jgi:hypothetical protein
MKLSPAPGAVVVKTPTIMHRRRQPVGRAMITPNFSAAWASEMSSPTPSVTIGVRTDISTGEIIESPSREKGEINEEQKGS